MVDEKQEIKEKTEDKEEDEKEEVEKSNTAVLETVAELAKAVKTISDNVTKVANDFNEFKEKALETPTDLPAKPEGSASDDDVGDEIKVPPQPYPQETSEQAGIDDASPESPGTTDGSGLEMQQKSVEISRENQFTTSTPRPGVQSVAKSDVEETPASKVLNAIRKSDSGEFQTPADALSKVAMMIRQGEFGRGEVI